MADESKILGDDLAKTPLAAVLIRALKQKVTGELAIEHEQGEDRIYFQAGIPTGTLIYHSFKPLGRFLLELGLIDLVALEQSIVLMGQGRRQGEALVEIGVLTTEEVDRALRLLQIRNLVEMAKLPRGLLTFEPNREPSSWTCGIPPHALRTLREVLAVEQSESVRNLLLDRFGGDHQPIRIPTHLEGNLLHFDLDDDEARAARLLFEPRTLASFWEFSQISLLRSRALAAELALTGVLVGYGLSEDTGRVAGRAESAARLKAVEARAQLDDLGREPQASVALREADRERRKRLVRRGLESSAPAAFARALSGLHAAPEPTAPEPPMPEPEASAPEPTAPAEAERPRRLPRRPRPRPTAPTARREPSGGAADAGFPEGGPMLEALIQRRFKLLPRLDHFALLEVPRTATPPQIKAAFVKAVQLFHPDHLPPRLEHLAPQQREIFAKVRQAYEVLSADDRRTEYLASLGGEAASAIDSQVTDAKSAAARGDSLLAKGDFAAAGAAFREAYKLEPHGDLLAAAAWCILIDPARKSEAGRARVELLQIASNHPEAERPPYYLGILARMEERPDEAEELFKKVLRINRKHLAAAQELRLLSLRGKRQLKLKAKR